MKRLMFLFGLAIVYGAISGVIGHFVTDWEYAPIVGGMIAGTLTAFTSDKIYDKLFVHKRKKVLSILEEMGED
jgi:phosphate/sulfate permease